MSKKKISVRKILSFICGVVVLVFIISTIYTAKSQDKTKNIINIFGYRPVVVVSGSMEPDILTNSISIMKYCSMEDVYVGDIIMYHHPSLGINITHRVVESGVDDVGNQYLITKGDANPNNDDIKVTSNMLIGKIISTYNETAPYVSFVMLDNGEVNTLALLQIIIFISVIITVCVLILYFLWNIAYSIFTVTAGRNYTRHLIGNYEMNLSSQNKYLGLVRNIHICKGDSLRVAIGKLILAKELKAFEQSVLDLEKAKNLALFTAGKDWSLNEYQDKK